MLPHTKATLLLLAVGLAQSVVPDTMRKSINHSILVTKKERWTDKPGRSCPKQFQQNIRGGGFVGNSKDRDNPKAHNGFLKGAFSPRVALKVISMGCLSFALPALARPTMFRDIFFSATAATDLSNDFQMLFGLRELLDSTMAWLISSLGSDDLWRNCLTAVFFILSPLQTFLLATSAAVSPDQRAFLVGFQVVIGLYLAITNLLAWTDKAGCTYNSIRREVRKKK
jgi:hypothetical protein